MIKKKRKGSVMENMIVMLLNMILLCAFLVIIFGAFSGVSDKWQMRQVAREYSLIMETEGYLKPADQANLIRELQSCGLYDISLSGTTTREVNYGDKIYLRISGKYDERILTFAGGLSKYATRTSNLTINRQTTAKQ